MISIWKEFDRFVFLHLQKSRGLNSNSINSLDMCATVLCLYHCNLHLVLPISYMYLGVYILFNNLFWKLIKILTFTSVLRYHRLKTSLYLLISGLSKRLTLHWRSNFSIFLVFRVNTEIVFAVVWRDIFFSDSNVCHTGSIRSLKECFGCTQTRIDSDCFANYYWSTFGLPFALLSCKCEAKQITTSTR